MSWLAIQNCSTHREIARSPQAVRARPATAHLPPSAILRGDELATTTFWHGKLLSQRAHAWVDYQTEGRGTYAITAMEDTGIMQSLTLLARAGRADLSRVLVVQATSNCESAAQNGHLQPRALPRPALRPLAPSKRIFQPLEKRAHRVGSRILRALLATWPHSAV